MLSMKKEDEKAIAEFIRKHKLLNKSKTNDINDIINASIIYLSGLRPNITSDNPLSTMQMYCLMLLATGRNPDQCADLLGISVHSVTKHEKRLRRKLGAKDRTHAYHLALRNNYISIINIKQERLNDSSDVPNFGDKIG